MKKRGTGALGESAPGPQSSTRRKVRHAFWKALTEPPERLFQVVPLGVAIWGPISKNREQGHLTESAPGPIVGVNLDAGVEKGSPPGATYQHHDGQTPSGITVHELTRDPAQTVLDIPRMVLSSKRVHEYFEQNQIVEFQGAFKVAKIHKTENVQIYSENKPRARKRKATSALPKQQPRKRQPKSDYSWRGEEQLPRALASVSARIAEKFPSLTSGRPPDQT